jgi:hypothetical protein
LALGYDCQPPRALARPVDLPDGAREARFLNVELPPIAPRSVSFFVCQHLTRDLVWRPEWERHANGADRVTDVIIAHPSPADLWPTHARLFGESAAAVDEESLFLTLGNGAISILAPAAFKRRIPSVPIPADIDEGWFAGATFSVRSYAAVERVFSEAGVAIARTPAGSIVVEPSEAAHTLLEFSAPS